MSDVRARRACLPDPTARPAGRRTANADLLLRKYLSRHDEKSAAPKQQLLEEAIGACQATYPLYARAYERWKSSLGSGVPTQEVEIDGRAVFGLGSESPLEAGLILQHPYGTPYFPGTALKGLAAHYSDQVWGKGDPRFSRHLGDKQSPPGECFQTMFGTTEDSGHLLFYDAWVTPDSLVPDPANGRPTGALALDVITVHHKDYYAGIEGKPPGDGDEPVPVPFLSIQGRFLLAVGCDVEGPEGEKWAGLGLRLLHEALENWGIGGKTSAGYGRIKGPDWRPPRRTDAPVLSPSPVGLVSGQEVRATLLEERTNKGGWKAKITFDGREIAGPIANTREVPADRKPGEKVTLKVHSISPSSGGEIKIQFLWPK
ncbi:MAG: type III-B CRISPR module RAMP protein Cmr6 [Bacillota bacterium]|nr:type III-B CRISPR module RAMP protein Cmr6 [Bacillota bacterium]